MVRLTEPEGSVVRSNLAEPPSSADTDADADADLWVVHYTQNVNASLAMLNETFSMIFKHCGLRRKSCNSPHRGDHA